MLRPPVRRIRIERVRAREPVHGLVPVGQRPIIPIQVNLVQINLHRNNNASIFNNLNIGPFPTNRGLGSQGRVRRVRSGRKNKRRLGWSALGHGLRRGLSGLNWFTGVACPWEPLAWNGHGGERPKGSGGRGRHRRVIHEREAGARCLDVVWDGVDYVRGWAGAGARAGRCASTC